MAKNELAPKGGQILIYQTEGGLLPGLSNHKPEPKNSSSFRLKPRLNLNLLYQHFYQRLSEGNCKRK